MEVSLARNVALFPGPRQVSVIEVSVSGVNKATCRFICMSWCIQNKKNNLLSMS